MSVSRGYTLIEILIALAVFAILSAMTANALQHAFSTKERVDIQANQLNSLQLTLSLITKDTEQVIDRAIIGADMRTSPPFIGQSHYVEFTRGGSVNPDELEKRSTLKRIAYLCKNKTLIRRSWHRLDTSSRELFQDNILLEDLNACDFSFIAANRQTLTEWHEYALQQNQKKESLPSAIQLNLDLKQWGNMSLIFPLAEAIYAGTN